MNLIKSFYKTKTLASNGIFISITVIILLVVGYFIPDFAPRIFSEQIYTLNGYNTKHNDHSEVSDFFLSIKNNNGFLVLGTSETGSLPGGNYYDFLNNDKDIEEKNFSLMAGAGRTCGIYIPLFLHHHDELDSLQLIYFINPVYWRDNLCEVDIEYWNRYSNYKMCNNLNLSAYERESFFYPVQAYNDKLNLFNKSISYLKQSIRSARRNYFNNLRYYFFPKEYTSQFNFMSDSKTDYLLDSQYGNVDYESIDTSWNIAKSFTNKEWFKPINESEDYRYKELTSFVKLCKELGIKSTFIIGPYNELFIGKYFPEDLDAHERTVQEIKLILLDNNADFIDATDISPVVGAFIDHQHHSSYGAYLIYLKIKHKLYGEKNN